MSSLDPAGQPNVSTGMSLPDYVLEDPAIRVLFNFADLLIPLFAIGETPVPMARHMAVDAILSYVWVR